LNPLLVILGPTASGKTHLATRVAAEVNGSILSVDSRQIYRGMDIGTGKDLEEYTVEGKSIPYHLINIRNAGEKYNISLFKDDFQQAYQEIVRENSVPIACGGTGFYLYALLKSQAYTEIPVNEELRESLEDQSNDWLRTAFTQLKTSYLNRADISTRKRLIRAIEISTYLADHPEIEKNISEEPSFVYNPIIFGLNPPPEIRRDRISTRLVYRVKNGLVEEVQSLLDSGLHPEQLIYYGLEYKYITEYVTGKLAYDEMTKKLETEIHRFAKRQMTFFRKMEKDGIHIHWLNAEHSEQENVREIIQAYNLFTTPNPNHLIN